MNLIFGFASARSCMIFDARSSSRRTKTVTDSANLVRKFASSMAVSPPPTITTFLSRKKNPSHVAQAETPLPLNRSSPGIPSHRADAPVAIITASAE